MSNEAKVTVEVTVRQAAAVRQILFEHQKGYTYDEVSVPERISDIRDVIQKIDDGIDNVLN